MIIRIVYHLLISLISLSIINNTINIILLLITASSVALSFLKATIAFLAALFAPLLMVVVLQILLIIFIVIIIIIIITLRVINLIFIILKVVLPNITKEVIISLNLLQFLGSFLCLLSHPINYVHLCFSMQLFEIKMIKPR